MAINTRSRERPPTDQDGDDRVDREFREAGMKARLILQVHDELIVEAPEREAAGSERILKEANGGGGDVVGPLTVSVSGGRTGGNPLIFL